MEPLNLEVYLPSGQQRQFDLAQDTDVREVLQALSKGGYLVLKNACHPNISTSYKERHIKDNKYVQALLASAQDGNFARSSCVHMLVDPDEPATIDRFKSDDSNEDPRLLYLLSHHLGGNEEDEWINEVYDGARRVSFATVGYFIPFRVRLDLDKD